MLAVPKLHQNSNTEMWSQFCVSFSSLKSVFEALVASSVLKPAGLWDSAWFHPFKCSAVWTASATGEEDRDAQERVQPTGCVGQAGSGLPTCEDSKVIPDWSASEAGGAADVSWHAIRNAEWAAPVSYPAPQNGFKTADKNIYSTGSQTTSWV